MSDRIDLGSRPWKAIPREVLRDPALSHQARGGLVMLLSHEDGWIRSAVAVLMNQGLHCGREKAQSILRELVAAGYATRERKRGAGGRFLTVYTIRAEKQVRGVEPALSPSPVHPSTGNPAVVVEPQEVEPQDEEPKEPRSLVRHEAERFAEFWDVYPRKQAKKAAAKAFRNATTSAVSAALIVAAARRFAADPNREPEFTPLPTTWLNQGRWDDEPLPSRRGQRYETPGEEFARRAREEMARNADQGGGRLGGRETGRELSESASR